jgi:hypothetical protein
MKDIIYQISQRKEIQEKPPVLIDIGASKELNPAWKSIAHFCIGIAFDADDRDFNFIEKESSDFKKLFIYNCIASNQNHQTKQKFFLTKSPYCSSTLMPDNQRLEAFSFAPLFEVEKEIDLNTVTLAGILEELQLGYVDWFKADTQGTDLRLFCNLPESIQKKVVMAEFEPGIIDAYQGEDKMIDVFQYMRSMPFQLADITVKGAMQMPFNDFKSMFPSRFMQKVANHTIKTTPGWSEMVFINKFENADCREFILGWLFASIQACHSLAFSIASKGFEQHKDPIFTQMKSHSQSMIKSDIYSVATLFKLIKLALK